MQALLPPPVPPQSGAATPLSSGSEEKVAIFIVKTFNLVDEATTRGMAGWTDDGKYLAIFDVERFTRLLPNFFRHSNFRSFIRQLNCYGFRKFRSEEIRQLPGDVAHAEAVFHHTHFQRGRKDLLSQIRIKREGDSSEIDDLRNEISSLHEQVAKLANLVQVVVQRTAPKRRRIALAEPYSPAAVVEDLDPQYLLLDTRRSLKRARMGRGISAESTTSTLPAVDDSNPASVTAAAIAAATSAVGMTATSAAPGLPLPLSTSTSWDIPSLTRLASSSSMGADFDDFSVLLGFDLPDDHQAVQLPKPPVLGLSKTSMENLLQSENSSAMLCSAPPALPDLLSRISVSGVPDPSQ